MSKKNWIVPSVCALLIWGCGSDSTNVSGFGGQSVTQIVASLRSITITPPSATFAALTNRQYTAVGTFADGSTFDVTQAVTWSSSNPAVVTVGANTGLATGVSAGTATITAQFQNFSATANATVTAPVLAGNYGLTGMGWRDQFNAIDTAANITFDGNGGITGGQLRRELNGLFGGLGPQVDAITGGSYTVDANRVLNARINTAIGTFTLQGTSSIDNGQLISGSMVGPGLVSLATAVKKPTNANLATLNGQYFVRMGQGNSGSYSGDLNFDGAGNVVGTITRVSLGVTTAFKVQAPSTYTVAADGAVTLSLTTDTPMGNVNPLPFAGYVGTEGTLVVEAPFDGVNFPTPIAGVAARRATTTTIQDFNPGTIGINLAIVEPGLFFAEPVKAGVVSGTATWNAAGQVTGGSLTYRDAGSFTALPVTVTGGNFVFNNNGTGTGTVNFTFTSPIDGVQNRTITVDAGDPSSMHVGKNAGSTIFTIAQTGNIARGYGLLMP